MNVCQCGQTATCVRACVHVPPCLLRALKQRAHPDPDLGPQRPSSSNGDQGSLVKWLLPGLRKYEVERASPETKTRRDRSEAHRSCPEGLRAPEGSGPHLGQSEQQNNKRL